MVSEVVTGIDSNAVGSVTVPVSTLPVDSRGPPQRVKYWQTDRGKKKQSVCTCFSQALTRSCNVYPRPQRGKKTLKAAGFARHRDTVKRWEREREKSCKTVATEVIAKLLFRLLLLEALEPPLKVRLNKCQITKPQTQMPLTNLSGWKHSKFTGGNGSNIFESSANT